MNMKKLLFVLGLAMLCGKAHAGSVTAIIDEGNSVSFSKVSVSTFVVTTLSAPSDSRKYLLCRNDSAFELFIGSFTTITSGGSAVFEVEPTTSTKATYVTRGHEGVYGIGLAGSAGTVTVYCFERR